jgi:hypothetical protein
VGTPTMPTSPGRPTSGEQFAGGVEEEFDTNPADNMSGRLASGEDQFARGGGEPTWPTALPGMPPSGENQIIGREGLGH